MDPVAKNFVRASLVYFFLAVCLGVILVYYTKGDPQYEQLRFAHVHLTLLGWVSMMIYGVGYHILPRFSGNPVAYPGLARVHLGLANISLLGLVGVYGYDLFLTKVFGFLQALSVVMFVLNMMASMKASPES